MKLPSLSSPTTRDKDVGELSFHFSEFPIILAIILKPLVDAFYEVQAVKYGYMIYIFFAVFFAHAGVNLSRSRDRALRGFQYKNQAILLSIYLIFLLVSLSVFGGSLNEVFKILSPFILFLLVAPVAGKWFIHAMGAASLLTIVGNAALLPFEYGWVYWGTVRTFKGFYYYKTDLAYAISFSLLGVALWQRFRFTPILVLSTIFSTAQVVLANSRLNYALFLVIVIFIAMRSGVRPWLILRNSIYIAALALIAAFLYDAKTFLDFDLSSSGKFTQGRDRIWDVLIVQGVLNYSFLELMFGKGMFADIILFAENVFTGEAHNAHNEWLHLIITQGSFGTLVYLLLWISIYRSVSCQRTAVVPIFAFLLIIIQSMTSVVSSFATKTWPLVFILLAVSSSENRRTVR